MLDLMGYMDAPSLGRLAFVSHALYVFAHVEELWKGLVVRVSSAWCGSACPITSEPVFFSERLAVCSFHAPLSERFLQESVVVGVKLKHRGDGWC